MSPPNEKLWAECKVRLVEHGSITTQQALYEFAIDQRKIACDANSDQASRAYERGKRDGQAAAPETSMDVPVTIIGASETHVHLFSSPDTNGDWACDVCGDTVDGYTAAQWTNRYRETPPLAVIPLFASAPVSSIDAPLANGPRKLTLKDPCPTADDGLHNVVTDGDWIGCADCGAV